MKNALVKSKLQSLRNSHSQDSAEIVKIITFEVGNVNLALPIQNVHKIVRQLPVHGSRPNGVGIAHLDDREVTIVDLQHQLFTSSENTTADRVGYTVIVKNTPGELFGIPVEGVPVLMEVAQSSIRVLPESYRQADSLGFATHVAVISDVEPPVTVFLLDIKQLLSGY